MEPVDHNVKQMLQTLGRALVQAIASSSDVTDAVRQIRHQGYSLQLVLDCTHTQEGGATIALTTRTDAAHPPEQSATKPPVEDRTPEPTFRLDGNDVAILRSLGIDPTRPGRRRRGGS